jgi:hypothetical protein
MVEGEAASFQLDITPASLEHEVNVAISLGYPVGRRNEALQAQGALMIRCGFARQPLIQRDSLAQFSPPAGT